MTGFPVQICLRPVHNPAPQTAAELLFFFPTSVDSVRAYGVRLHQDSAPLPYLDPSSSSLSMIQPQAPPHPISNIIQQQEVPSLVAVATSLDPLFFPISTKNLFFPIFVYDPAAQTSRLHRFGGLTAYSAFLILARLPRPTAQQPSQ